MKKLKRIYIEITNMCNLKCEFCPTTKRQPRMITVEEFEEVLIRTEGMTDHIYLHVLGEPLLHPKLRDLLQCAQSHALQVNLTTNGVLLKERQAVLLESNALRQINISLHCINANANRVQFQDYLTGVSSFVQAALSQGRMYVALRLWNLDATVGTENRAENERIFDFLSAELGISINFPEGKTLGNGIQLLPHLYLSQGEEFEWPSLDRNHSSNSGFCLALRDQVAILVDGNVVPCCLDSNGTIVLGNLHETGLRAILSGQRAQALVNGFSQQRAVEELCQKCTFRNRFDK